MLAECKALRKRSWNTTAADISSVTSSAVAAIESENVCALYCNVIGMVCEAKKKNCAACGAGAVSAVLAMMQAHPSSKTVQTMACFALSWLVQGGPGISIGMVASGGLGLVYAAMAAYPTAEVLQKYACVALSVLAETPECAKAMRAEGRAVGLLRQAMSAHPDDKTMQDNAAKALSSLVEPEVRQHAFLNAFLLCVF